MSFLPFPDLHETKKGPRLFAAQPPDISKRIPNDYSLSSSAVMDGLFSNSAFGMW